MSAQETTSLGLPVITSGQQLEWREHTACAGVDPEVFVVDGMYPVNSADYKAAVAKAFAYCDRCSVQEQCLEFGMSQPLGIWGRTTSSQRKTLRAANRDRIITLYIERQS